MAERILILGGGFGGLTAAVELKRLCGDRVDVTVVDREPRFTMGLAKLWVASGRRGAEECVHDRRRVERHGVKLVLDEVRALDVGSRRVETAKRTLAYDRLIVALGLDVVPEAVPGLVEHGLDLYHLEGAERVNRALEPFAGGDLLLVVCGTPFKCPPAPFEAALLFRERLQRSGVWERTRFEILTPEPRPMPILPAEHGQKVLELVTALGIRYAPQHKLSRVEPGRALFEGGIERRFDLLIAIPPHRPPALLRQVPGLTDQSGLVLVDRHTLATPIERVYAVGDCAKVTSFTDLPIPRAGVLAEAEARIVAANLAAEVLGRPAGARFDGVGYCFLETGGGEALKMVGEFLAEPAPRAHFPGGPSAADYQAKLAFERERLASWFGE
jgi:sulfide:quinone oxidoreductase